MTPFTKEELNEVLKGFEIEDISLATIRQCSAIAAALEKRCGEPFSHLEIGVPGLPPCPIGIEAQKAALDERVASLYPPILGVESLKKNASRFLKAFLDIDLAPEGIIPTTGSMQAAFLLTIECAQMDPTKDTILYICPGFPPHGRQPDVLGIKNIPFDIYEHRAEKLRTKLESYFEKGNIAAILYSNPNNPAWICLSEEELKIIGDLCNKYDVIALEDMAYLCMDFRLDLSKPFRPPFQATVARYTDNYVLMLSGSKIFSYAGERVGIACISDKLFHRHYPALQERYSIATFGQNFANTYLYVSSSGTSHSAQCALAAMLEAAVDGRYDFVGEMREYGRRSQRSRDIFAKHGFNLVYDRDLDRPISDGFFYTVGYPGLGNHDLMEVFFRCGIVAIALNATGSDHAGLRICVSRLGCDEDFERLDRQLANVVKLINSN